MKTNTKALVKKSIKKPFWIATVLALSGLLGISSCTKSEMDADEDLNALSLQAMDGQLKEVRKVANRFHSFKQAEKAGYAELIPGVNPSPYVPHMGYHYTNLGLLDETFELKKPEILLYVPNAQGKLKLVGVEYAVPGTPESTPPEGFDGDEDQWAYNPHVAGGAWTLHAWVVLENPDGVFAPLNPNVPASDPSAD